MGSSPYAAGPRGGGCGEGAVGEGGETEAAVFEDGVTRVGLDGGPDGEWAVVYYGEEKGLLSCGRESYGERDEGEERVVERHVCVFEERFWGLSV